MLFFLLFFSPDAAAAIFTDFGTYPLKAEWKEVSPAAVTLADARYEYAMSFSAYENGSEKPKFTSETNQSIRWKKMPAEEGVDHFEMVYEAYRTRSKMELMPGMDPHVTAQDLSLYLSAKPLSVSGSGGQPKKIDNLEAVRAQLAAEVKDPAARQALLMTFREEVVLDGMKGLLQDYTCIPGAGNKAIGAVWKGQLDTASMKLSFDCKFDGWAEAGGVKVMSIGITLAKSRQVSKLPSGATANVETEGAGTLYFEPKSKESLTKMELTISELGQNKGKNFSKLKTSTHARAL
ncbi:MAG: hypothetical protein AB7K68_00020 [Bacteriovoracia bacterium]